MISSADPRHIQERFAAAVELHRFGVAIMRQDLRRRHADETDAQIDARLAQWLNARPGDADGTPVPWPRPRR